MTNIYYDQRLDNALDQVEAVGEQIKEELQQLTQLDDSINKNPLIVSGRVSENIDYVKILQELNKYNASSTAVTDILYLAKGDNRLLATKIVAEYEDGVFWITKNGGTTSFDPSSFSNHYGAALVHLSDGAVSHLLYLPEDAYQGSQTVVYLLDTLGIQTKLRALLTDEVQAAALVSPEGEIVEGVNVSLLLPYMDDLVPEDRIHKLDDHVSLCVSGEVMSGFYLVSYVSNDTILREITTVFFSAYMTFLWIVVVSILLVLIAMNITYVPLKKLVKKVVPNTNQNLRLLDRLEDTYLSINRQNIKLQEKVEKYRNSIQRNMLDSLVKTESGVKMASEDAIDQFFNEDIEKEIFAVYLSAPSGTVPEEAFLNEAGKLISNEHFYIVIESDENYTHLLLNYIGVETGKRDRLEEILQELYETYGCLSAISRGSDSPMDIPLLYQSVVDASRAWPDKPVVRGRSGGANGGFYAYPHDKLMKMSDLMVENDFKKVNVLINELFQIIGENGVRNKEMEDFYAHSILIDMLMNIVNSMGQSGIEFSVYQDLYQETLYLCRSFTYEAKRDEIRGNIQKLLDIYEAKSDDYLFSSAPYRKIMEENYLLPEFSISVLAEMFQVSVSYMSHQFKKEMKITFSEYLWKMRLNKAKELLETTDMTTEEISLAVGYYSVTSFMKKFKMETGMTLSQFRAQKKGTIHNQKNMES